MTTNQIKVLNDEVVASCTLKTLVVTHSILTKGNPSIFKIQSRARTFLSILHTFKSYFERNIPRHLVEGYEQLKRDTYVIDHEASYHISIEMSKRRLKSIQGSKGVNTVFMDCPICYADYPQDRMITCECSHIQCPKCHERIAQTDPRCPVCRRLDTTRS